MNLDLEDVGDRRQAGVGDLVEREMQEWWGRGGDIGRDLGGTGRSVGWVC